MLWSGPEQAGRRLVRKMTPVRRALGVVLAAQCHLLQLLGWSVGLGVCALGFVFKWCTEAWWESLQQGFAAR